MKGRPNMEELITQWAISAGMILAGIAAAVTGGLLVTYLTFLVLDAITLAIFEGKA